VAWLYGHALEATWEKRRFPPLKVQIPNCLRLNIIIVIVILILQELQACGTWY